MLTPTPHGRSGSPEPVTSAIPLEAMAMLEEGTASDKLLLARATALYNEQNRQGAAQRFYGTVDDDTLQDMIAAAQRISIAYETWMQPAGETAILEALADIADMLQCSVPNANGIALYTQAMNVPHRLLDLAKRKVAASHKYSRLPLPKDFNDAIIDAVAWCNLKRGWPSMLSNDLSRAFNLRTNRRKANGPD